ncbi:unnamed protein product [Gordionus sp. m RMFG-2023]
MFDFGKDPINFLLKAYQEYGPVFSFTMLGKKFTYLCNTEAIACFFNSKNEDLNAEEVYSSLVTPVFGSGVIYDVPHNIFMEQKKMIKNGLIQARYRIHVPIIENETLDFIQRLMINHKTIDDQSFKLNILETMAELIIFTSSACLMGKEAREALTEEVAKWYTDLDGGFCIEAWLFPEWMPFPAFKKRDAAHLKIKNLFLGIIAKRRLVKERLNNGFHTEKEDNVGTEIDQESDGDMIDTFMNSKYKSGRYTTDEEVAKLMISLLMAGQHTSSTTSSWLLLFLAKHQDIQQKVYQEVLDNCDISNMKSDQKSESRNPIKKLDLNLDSLKRLELLDRCLKETLRLRPPLLTLMRLCKKDISINVTQNNKMKCYVIPSGYQVCVSPTFTHQLKTYWHSKNGHFDPNRYINSLSVVGSSDEEPPLTANEINNYLSSNADIEKFDNGLNNIKENLEQALKDDRFKGKDISKCPFHKQINKLLACKTDTNIPDDTTLINDTVKNMIKSVKDINDTKNDRKFSYFPFGAGRHRCVGEAFAYIQIKTLVSTLLVNFEFSLVEGDKEFNQEKANSSMDNSDSSLGINYKTLISTPLKPYLIVRQRGF